MILFSKSCGYINVSGTNTRSTSIIYRYTLLEKKNLLGASFLSAKKEIRTARSRAQCSTRVCCSERGNNDQL